MPTITEPLRAHHGACDNLFAAAEAAAAQSDWNACSRLTEEFLRQLEEHFLAEEAVLFPAFEAFSGSQHGPTAVMRMEHGQMRELGRDLNAAATSADLDAYLGAAQTLLILMQQHNLKEERILYPMCDQALGTSCSDIGETIAQALQRALA